MGLIFKDIYENMYSCESENDLYEISSGATVYCNKNNNVYSLYRVYGACKHMRSGKFTFDEVNLVYRELSGKDIGAYPLSERLQDELSYRTSCITDTYRRAGLKCDSSLLKKIRAGIVENFTIEDACSDAIKIGKAHIFVCDIDKNKRIIFAERSGWYHYID